MSAYNPVKNLVGHRFAINCVAFSPCGKYLASGSDDKSVKIWDVNTGNVQYEVNFESPVLSVLWHPEQAHTIFCGTLNGSVFHCTELTKAKQNGKFLDFGTCGAVHGLAYCTDFRLLAAVCSEEVHIIKDDPSILTTVKLPVLRSFPQSSHPIRPRSLHFMQGGRTLLVSFLYHGVVAWDISTGKELWKIAPTSHREKIGSSALSTDEQWLLVHNITHGIDIISLTSKETVKSLAQESPDSDSFPVNVAFVDGDSTAVSGSSSGNIYIWDHEAQELRQVLGHEDDVVQAIGVFQDETSTYIAAGTSTQGSGVYIKLWKSKTVFRGKHKDNTILRLTTAYLNKDAGPFFSTLALLCVRAILFAFAVYLLASYIPWRVFTRLTVFSLASSWNIALYLIVACLRGLSSAAFGVKKVLFWGLRRLYEIGKRALEDFEHFSQDMNIN